MILRGLFACKGTVAEHQNKYLKGTKTERLKHIAVECLLLAKILQIGYLLTLSFTMTPWSKDY